MTAGQCEMYILVVLVTLLTLPYDISGPDRLYYFLLFAGCIC